MQTAIERRSATLTLDATFTECLSRLSALPASHTRAGQRIRSLYLTYQRATGGIFSDFINNQTYFGVYIIPCFVFDHVMQRGCITPGVMAWRSAVDWLLRLPNPSLSLLQELLQV